VLPALLHALGVDARSQPLWLLGHSDGGSIALLFAAWAAPAQAPAGLVVLAPHIMVEDRTLEQVKHARHTYEQGNLRARLAAFHADPDSAFWGWNQTWLLPTFKTWSIEPELSRIRCPVLAIQGEDDEYATLKQIEGIARCHPATSLLALPDCGHWPHTHARTQVLLAVAEFMACPGSVSADRNS
jgi:pimeloyl-ACP methyl ester carboxylesterase